MSYAKSIRNATAQGVTGRKIINAVRSLADPEGSTISEIRKCVVSRLQLDKIPDQEDLKVLLDEAVNRGALTKIGRKFKIAQKEKNKKMTGKITKRQHLVKRDAKSKLMGTRKLNARKGGVNFNRFLKPELAFKKGITKIVRKEKSKKVASKDKKRQRTEKSDTGRKMLKKRSQDEKIDAINSDKTNQSEQMPDSSVPKIENEENKTVNGEKTKTGSTKKIGVKSKSIKKRKLDANKADENSEGINQACPAPEKCIPKMAEEDKNVSITVEVAKRQRTDKGKKRSKKSLSRKRSQNSKKSDANSEDTCMSQSTSDRGVARGNFAAARLNDLEVDDTDM